MSRISYQQSFMVSIAVRERFQYSSAQGFESRVVFRRHRYDSGTVQIALGKHRRRKSRQVALIQRHDMTNICHLSENKAIFLQQRFRTVDDHDEKIGVCGFSPCTINADRFDLVTRTSYAGSIDKRDWNAIYSDRLGK